MLQALEVLGLMFLRFRKRLNLMSLLNLEKVIKSFFGRTETGGISLQHFLPQFFVLSSPPDGSVFLVLGFYSSFLIFNLSKVIERRCDIGFSIVIGSPGYFNSRFC